MFTPMEANRRESSSLRVTSDLSVQPSFYLQTVVLQTEVENSIFFSCLCQIQPQRRNWRCCKVLQILQSNRQSKLCSSVRCLTRRSQGNGLRMAWKLSPATVSRLPISAGQHSDSCTCVRFTLRCNYTCFKYGACSSIPGFIV